MDYSVPYGEYLVIFLLLHSVCMCLQVCILLPSGAHLCHLYFKEVVVAHYLADRLIIYTAF